MHLIMVTVAVLIWKRQTGKGLVMHLKVDSKPCRYNEGTGDDCSWD